MILFTPTLILRHRKENLKKCSLRGLESREDFKFFTYPTDPLPPLNNYILLTPDAPTLTKNDASYGVFLIDATWRYAAVMLNSLKAPHHFECRSIPSSITTAYPRAQNEPHGLASIEALFIAYLMTGRDASFLLNHYYWKKPFLEKNRESIDFLNHLE
jgi:pre-rRNA-processing protein TSR3